MTCPSGSPTLKLQATAPRKERDWVATGLLSLAAIALSVLRLPQTLAFDDVVANVETARRVAEGERIFRDFTSPLGPSAVALQSTLLRLSLSPAAAFQITSGLLCLFCGYAALRRLSVCESGFVRGVGALSVGFLAAYGGYLGAKAWDWTTYAGNYNSYGFALLVLLLLEIARQTLGKGSPLFMGIAVAIFAFIKVTNVAIGAVLLVVFLAFAPNGRRLSAVGRVAFGLFVGYAITYVFVPFSPVAYFHDGMEMIRVSPVGHHDLRPIVDKARNGLPTLIILTCASLWLSFWPRFQLSRNRSLVWLGIALLVSGTMLVYDVAATQNPLPCAPIALAVVFAVLSSDLEKGTNRAYLLGGCAFCLLGTLVATPAQICKVAAWNLRYYGAPPLNLTPLGFAFTATPDSSEPIFWNLPLEDFGMPASNLRLAYAYEDALALVGAQAKPSDILMTDDFSNVCVAAGIVRGPTGDFTAWHWGRNVGDRQRPLLRHLLAESTWILTWKNPHSLVVLKASALRDEMNGRYSIAATSRFWVLWKRTNGQK